MSRYVITSYSIHYTKLYEISPPFTVQADAQEVDAVFEVPLSFLLDPRNHQRHRRAFQGRMISYFAMPYGEHYIWGATAAMLVNLYRQLVFAEP